MSFFARCTACDTKMADATEIKRCAFCNRTDMIETIEAPTGSAVAPPERPMKRALSWNVFERRFKSLNRQDGSLIWEPSEVPEDADWHYWWTVVDPMTTGTLYLAAGFHFVNRLGYIRCAMPWGGEWQQHPEYVY